MFSRKSRGRAGTASWRFALWTTLAFAVGSAAAFLILSTLVANIIRERSDAWLTGEVRVLAEVAESTPRDSVYDRMVEEVAEHAAHEIPADSDPAGRPESPVFFLYIRPGEQPLWVGPPAKQPFLHAIESARMAPGAPESVSVPAHHVPYRVVLQPGPDGGAVYLGLSDRSARHTLQRLTERFTLIWAAMVLLGFAISWASARRILGGVEAITGTAASIGSDNLRSRVPVPRADDEISRLARTFNGMLDRIESSVHQLQTLTDSVAHDLKSPVTSIRGRLEVLLSAGGEVAWREPVAGAVEQLDRLSSLLTTILDVAEGKAGALRLHRTRLDLTEIAEMMADLYQPALGERGHTLGVRVEGPAPVNADPVLLQRAVANLLDNEIRHLPPGRHIDISVRVKDDTAELTVEDDGPGFPPELRQNIFERFVKGRHSTGHGLGLAFVDTVARAHEGTVAVDDNPRPGGGARIRLRLPLAAPDPPVRPGDASDALPTAAPVPTPPSSAASLQAR